MTSSEALALAKEKAMTLLVVRATAVPPVCRLLTFQELNRILEKEKTKKTQAETEAEKRQASFTFDPSLKVKGLRFSAAMGENDMKRKVEQMRAFLKSGYRVEVQFLSGKSFAGQAVERLQRLCGEVMDLCKPANLPIPINAFRQPMIIIKFWPCTAEQAAAFTLPSVVLSAPKKDTKENPEKSLKIVDAKRKAQKSDGKEKWKKDATNAAAQVETADAAAGHDE